MSIRPFLSALRLPFSNNRLRPARVVEVFVSSLSFFRKRDRRWLYLLLIVLAASFGFFLLADREKPSDIKCHDKLLTLSEDEIDVGRVALELEKELFPHLDIDPYLKQIDALADRVRALVRGSQDPQIRMRAMNTVLYIQEKFRFDRESLKDYAPHAYLHYLLDTKRGDCLSMATLQLAVAQRLGYPVYPAYVPRHVILRYVTPGMAIYNIDPANQGAYILTRDFISAYSISQKTMEGGFYLQTLTYRNYLASLAYTASFAYEARSLPYYDFHYMDCAYSLDKDFTPPWQNYSYYLERRARMGAVDEATARTYWEKVAEIKGKLTKYFSEEMPL